jgi:hypothetical protein
MKVVCPGCESRIVEVDAFPCTCGYRPTEGREKLIERWQVPAGREAEVERAILLRRTSEMMGFVLSVLVMFIVGIGTHHGLAYLGSTENSLWANENVRHLLTGGAMLLTFFLVRSLVTPPLPVGKREAELVG